MLILKLVLVPAFLLLISLAGRRWGPGMAGWLAGLPVVAGPILFFLAVERGTGFAAGSAVLALSAVFASVSFSLVYAHAAQRRPWPWALVAALAAWASAALALSWLPSSVVLAAAVALLTLVIAPGRFPKQRLEPAARRVSGVELACRMLAGAALTVGVTVASAKLGPAWSGLLAVFPVLGIVLAVFSHRSLGAAYAAALLRAMVTGLYAFVAFCGVLAVSLQPLGIGGSFALATLAALGVQALTRKRF